MAETITKVKVKETNANDLPEPLQPPGKDRTFEVLKQTGKEPDFPNGRFLLKTPKGMGGYPIDHTEESWWVPRDSCEILEKEGMPVAAEVKETPAPKKEEVVSKPVETKIVEKKVETKAAPVAPKVEEKLEKQAAEVKVSGIKEKLKTDAEAALYISAGNQLSKAVREGILAGVEKLLVEKYGPGKKNQSKVQGALEGFKFVLETPFGQALIQSGIGYGMDYVPVDSIKNDPRIQRLASGMRVQGMVVASDAVIGAAMSYVMPAIMAAVGTLPALNSGDLPAEESKPEQEQVVLGAGSSATKAA